MLTFLNECTLVESESPDAISHRRGCPARALGKHRSQSGSPRWQVTHHATAQTTRPAATT